jgi:hypothetical protein
MRRAQIELDIERAIIAAARWIRKGRESHFSLIPSKGINDEGLGLGLNAYTGFVASLFTEYLPEKAPYKDFEAPELLVKATLDEPLRALRYELTEILFSLKSPAKSRAKKLVAKKGSANKIAVRRQRS